MENKGAEKNMSLQDMMGDFIESYAQRDTNVEFADWLSDRLHQELPEMDTEACARLTDEIVKAIAGYNQALVDLNQSGMSKDEWLANELEKAYAGMSTDAAGKALMQMDRDLISSAAQVRGEPEFQIVENEPAEWNKFNLKEKAYGIGQRAVNVAFCAAADALDKKVNGEKVAVGDIVAGALQNGLNASPDEVKAVVAGVVHAAARKGLSDVLPPDVPIEVVGGLAGAAVDGAVAVYDAAKGNIKPADALEKVGKAGVAAGCRFAAVQLHGYVMGLPYGPLLANLLGGLFEHMESPRFINNVYTVVKDAAIATWEGVKKSEVGSTVIKVGKEVAKVGEKVGEKVNNLINAGKHKLLE